MANDTNNSKLEQAVKQTLSNYQAPYAAGDWAKMESMLDAVPQSGAVNRWQLRNIFIGIAVLGIIYLVYTTVVSSKKMEQPGNTEAQKPQSNPVNTIAPAPVAVPPPAPAAVVAAPLENQPEEEPAVDETLEEPAVTKTENETKKETADEGIKKSVKEKVAKKDSEKPSQKKKQTVNTMGNEPIFGDMLDSSKGIVGKTKEKEATKKAAKSQPDNPIGWSSFLLKNNLDSLKKYHDQQQKDSLKK